VLGWFKLMQEMTTDLRGAARIILKQNPHALKWASARFWEFGEILAHRYRLDPDRSANGIEGGGLLYSRVLAFDQYYGVDRADVYHEPAAYLLLSLVLQDEKRPATIFKATLNLNVVENEGEDGEKTRCYGQIRLTGRYGKSWEIHARLRCDDEAMYKELCERFYDVFKPEYFKEERFEGRVTREKQCDVTCDGKTNSADARDLFRDMVEYFIAKQEKT
jgi:hypothetical protein